MNLLGLRQLKQNQSSISIGSPKRSNEDPGSPLPLPKVASRTMSKISSNPLDDRIQNKEQIMFQLNKSIQQMFKDP